MWGRLAACGGLLTRVVNPWERRLTTGAQLTKLPHNRTCSSGHNTKLNWTWIPLHPIEQPGTRELPIPPHRCHGNAQRLRGLFVGMTAKISKLDDLRRARINLLQIPQRLVE